VFEEGASSSQLVVVESGRLRIERDYFGGRIPINEAHAGDILGEVSVVEGGAASASAVAVTPVTALVLVDPATAVGDDPALAAAFYHSLAVLLAQRLRYSTDDRRDFAAAFSWA
jgi:CRP-like cAMP-binding protein